MTTPTKPGAEATRDEKAAKNLRNSFLGWNIDGLFGERGEHFERALASALAAARAEGREEGRASLSHSYPHMCRDEHDEMGFRSDDEMCPACRARAEGAADATIAERQRIRDTATRQHKTSCTLDRYDDPRGDFCICGDGYWVPLESLRPRS